MRRINFRLKFKIIEKFGTQADFAYEIKSHEETVSRVVNARRTLSAKKQEQWAKALGCEVKDIFCN